MKHRPLPARPRHTDDANRQRRRARAGKPELLAIRRRAPVDVNRIARRETVHPAWDIVNIRQRLPRPNMILRRRQRQDGSQSDKKEVGVDGFHYDSGAIPVSSDSTPRRCRKCGEFAPHSNLSGTDNADAQAPSAARKLSSSDSKASGELTVSAISVRMSSPRRWRRRRDWERRVFTGTPRRVLSTS